jgi:hypothetical protein
VYSLQQGRRDVETVFTMGIMEDVNLVPQPAGGRCNLLLTLVKYVYIVPAASFLSCMAEFFSVTMFLSLGKRGGKKL